MHRLHAPGQQDLALHVKRRRPACPGGEAVLQNAVYDVHTVQHHHAVPVLLRPGHERILLAVRCSHLDHIGRVIQPVFPQGVLVWMQRFHAARSQARQQIRQGLDRLGICIHLLWLRHQIQGPLALLERDGFRKRRPAQHQLAERC